MGSVRWVNVNPSEELGDRAKYRLAFRDVIAWGELLWSFQPPMTLTEKAQKFFDTFASGNIGYPASQPVIGANGTVFVIDIRTKPDAPYLPVRNAMTIVEETVPGLELVSVELVSESEGSAAGVQNRERTFQAAADIDAMQDWDANPLNGPVDAAKQAAAGVSVLAVLVGVIVVVMLAKGARHA